MFKKKRAEYPPLDITRKAVKTPMRYFACDFLKFTVDNALPRDIMKPRATNREA